MIIVRNYKGKAIHRFKNLGGLRKLISKRWQSAVSEYPTGLKLVKVGSKGILVINFANKDFCIVTFESYQIMTEVVGRWRNLMGLPITRTTSAEVKFEDLLGRSGAGNLYKRLMLEMPLEGV